MTELNWGPGLDALYDGVLVKKLDEEERQKFDSHKKYMPRTSWREKTGYAPKQTGENLSYMDEVGLISEHEETGAMNLTELGFRVALERRQAKHEKELREDQQEHEEQLVERQTSTNRMIGYFTASLVIINGLQALANNPLNSANIPIYQHTIALIVGLAIGYFITEYSSASKYISS